MAGSWQHMTTKSGKLRNNETFCDQIENGGDFYEALEECYGMVQWLAAQLADACPDTAHSRADWVDIAQANYQDGLRLGGVQRS